MSRQEQVEKFFIDENCLSNPKEILSPSGRFKLIINHYKTKEGGWNYSRGRVFRVSDGALICDIKRNYSCFHHSFVTKNNQEWLITGRSYMSQTIVNLDTGQEFEPSGEHYNGFAFCWAQASLSPDENTLLVAGCYWAAPYEYKFFDFSDPSKGWPELELDDFVEEGSKPPEFNADGTITCFETRNFCVPLNKYENDLSSEDFKSLQEETEKTWRHETVATTTLKRQENQMVVVDQWVSDAEKERRKRAEQANREYEQWLKEFREGDVLYLKMKTALKNSKHLKPDSYDSCGHTYEGWCPEFTGKEKRWCRRILEKSNGYTIDLEWGVKTGPIKLVIYSDGKKTEDKFFPHSEKGMEEALTYAESLIAS